MEDWWSEETKERFAARQRCFVDEYDGYGFASLDRVPDYKGRTTVDGNRTLGENIADNGGLREAYRADRDHVDRNNGGDDEMGLPALGQYSADQLFFMSYATMYCESKTVSRLARQLLTDVHPPHIARVTGVLRGANSIA